MSTLTTELAAGLDGPDWLRARRAKAAERVATEPLPSTDDEIWRYSRIAELDLDRYTPVGSGPLPEVPPAARRWSDLTGQRTAAVITVNGLLADVEAPANLAGNGITIGPAAEGEPGAVMAEPTDVFAGMNDAFVTQPLSIAVAARTQVEHPIVVIHWIDRPEAAVFPRLVVDVGDGASLGVVEIFVSADVDALCIPVTELVVGRDAKAGYLSVQDLGRRMWQIGSLLTQVDTQAHFVGSTAAFGGSYARLRTDCRLVGRGAHGDLVSLYFGDGDQMLDFRTFQDHEAPDTTSDLLFKGCVDDRSHSVYTGLIRVRPEARGTNAFQTNRNIKLGEHAWAESVPNLEIENNEVRCSHASTVGPVDAEQLFYLESRGVPTEAAERLIVAGFFDEVVERLPVAELVPVVRQELATKLDNEPHPVPEAGVGVGGGS